jgi:hypothetical protein
VAQGEALVQVSETTFVLSDALRRVASDETLRAGIALSPSTSGDALRDEKSCCRFVFFQSLSPGHSYDMSTGTPKIVNKSGVVLTKDGQRLFGMDAAHYVKMQAKEDPEWDKKVLAWLSALLGEDLGSDDLWAVLKNGTVLIRAVNTLKPGTVAKYNRARLVPLLEMDNIQLYLKACWNLGVPSGL